MTGKGCGRLLLLIVLKCGIFHQSASQINFPIDESTGGATTTAPELESKVESPKVAIKFPDIGDKDFVNETLAVVSNSNAVFVLECNATYPIEWIFHYSEEDDGTNEQAKLAETHRYAPDFEDSSSYLYTANLRVGYNGKLLVLSHFTCKPTQTDNRGRQTHVYMTDKKRKSILILEISNEYRGELLDPPEPIDDNRNCERGIATVAYLLNWKNPCWTCKVPNGEELELDFQKCQTPIECNSMQARQRKSKECLQIVDKPSKTCKIDSPRVFHPKLVLCKNFGPVLSQFYFFGIYHGVLDLKGDKTLGPPIYYDWNDADPSQMLYIHPIKSEVFTGEEMTFKCEYSRFYFSLGSWFAIKSPNGTMKYMQEIDSKPCETASEFVSAREAAKVGRKSCNDSNIAERMGTFTSILDIKFEETGPHQVFCIGPVWNTTEWVNTSLSFIVQEGENPLVTSVDPDKKETFFVGQRNRSLKCNFKGRPTPTVSWMGPNGSFFTENEGNSSRTLSFSEIGYQSSGKYTCHASSFLGNHSRTFTVNPEAPPFKLSGGVVTGIVVVSLIVILLVVGVVARMRQTILEQRKALRLLTESEINDFLDGDPEVAKRAQFEYYFDTTTAIDSLPYDQEYEIPIDKLLVDYSNFLGTGQFGLVLKGKLHPQYASNYVNLALENDSDTDADTTKTPEMPTEQFIVAVKVCKKNVGVQSFKALLSEVKVMAYLGQHENIVSLIGASTENIRNRELHVVVEFCQNGGLDSFFKKHKKKFFNKVKYGYYHHDLEPPTPVRPLPTNKGDACVNIADSNNARGSQSPQPDHVFSSDDLIRWTRDIAAGLEYIHSKKVIHGDLAIRNVLITEKYTAKVGDFGLSKQLGEMSNYTKTTQCPLPWRNMAIESLKQLDFSVKSDMWSLGVTLWELFTLGDVPYPGLTYTMEFVKEIETGSLRLLKPMFATNDIYEFMLLCWAIVPADRPSTVEIRSICEKLLNSASESPET